MDIQELEVQVTTHGVVPDSVRQYATDKVTQLTRYTNRPILFAQVKLTLETNPRLERPALAEATLDLNGQPVRAHVAGHDLMEAVDLLEDRLRRRLDRHNHRIVILTKEGKFVAEYFEFGRSSGLAIDKNDTIYTADSESTAKVHPGWQRGVRIGSLKDGKVTVFIPPHAVPNSADGTMGEGIAIDAAGNVFTAEAQLRGVTKYVKDQ